jgi:hypothetical protein
MSLRTPVPFLCVALSLVSVAAAAQPLRRPIPVAPHKLVGAPPPPAAKGWPHDILSANATTCARTPGPNEVIVYKDPNFGGACSVLTPGFYPYGTNLGVGNDAIRSIKVGSAVRARAFLDMGYAGAWTQYPPGNALGTLGPAWDHQISSMRVEPGNRSAICNDLQEGEVALFEGWSGAGDCVVLPAQGGYPSADAMGIANDTISSVNNNSSSRIVLFWDQNYGREGTPQIPPHTFTKWLPESSAMLVTIDNNCSSLQVQPP